MIDWILANLSTIIVSLLLLFIVSRIIKSQIKTRHTCGHGCSSCAMAGSCHPKSKEEIVKEMRKSL